MDIETKAYRVLSTSLSPGALEIRDKATGCTEYIRREALPSVGELSAMSEGAFNRAVSRALHDHATF